MCYKKCDIYPLLLIGWAYPISWQSAQLSKSHFHFISQCLILLPLKLMAKLPLSSSAEGSDIQKGWLHFLCFHLLGSKILHLASFDLLENSSFTYFLPTISVAWCYTFLWFLLVRRNLLFLFYLLVCRIILL